MPPPTVWQVGLGMAGPLPKPPVPVYEMSR